MSVGSGTGGKGEMSVECAIRFVDVAKCFQVRHEGPLSFQSVALNLLHLQIRQPKHKHWVLRNVSFSVRRGEMVGVIGVNGSGKSTMLKLVSRIIEPTVGSVEVKGRVSALLELGAGFHPDLTGRENVYLNGSVLGLSRREISAKFDEIVQFADLESSIDVPVRFYSSGMYMRLGFSVAVHANPEILLVDEVLAVGDYAFQMKCLRRIEELRRQGVTILFVSHDMDIVQEMCDRAIWLDGGGVRAEGNPFQVVEQYLCGFAQGELELGRQSSRLARGQRWGSGEIELTHVRFLDANGLEKAVFVTGEAMQVEIQYVAHKRIRSPVFGMAFHSSEGAWISESNTASSGCDVGWVEGQGQIIYHIESLPFMEGNYLFTATAYDYSQPIHQAYDHLDKAFLVQVRCGDHVSEPLGMIYVPSRWEHKRQT